MAEEEKKSGFKGWTERHEALWQFILFNILSNISTVTRFVCTWVGTAVLINTMQLTSPFRFLIFDYTGSGSNGLGGFCTFLIAEVLAQVVNYFVQMRLVFKSDASAAESGWKYAVLAVVIVVVNLILPGHGQKSMCQSRNRNARLAPTNGREIHYRGYR